MKLLIIDSHSIAHRIKFGYWHRKFKTKNTGIVFGFWMKVLEIVDLVEPDQVIFTFDGHREQLLRKKIYPKYKDRDELDEKNKEINEIAIPQFHIIKEEFLPSIGFNNLFQLTGYEADDIIASIVFDERYQEDEKVIASSDHDLYQLLRYNIDFYNIITDKIYTAIDFWKEHGIRSNRWQEVKALAGCTSDNIDGINGVGDKTAIKWMLGQIKRTSKIYKKIRPDYDAVMKVNMPLVELPYQGCPDFDIKEDTLDLNRYNRIVEQYGFLQFLKGTMLEKFKILL